MEDTTQDQTQDSIKAGTGFMEPLSEAIEIYRKNGYTENLVPYFDHLATHSNNLKIWPSEIIVDEVCRFENSSDPSDQSILYVISVPSRNLKGLYTESYGLYHDNLSEPLQEALKLRH
jgi:hypothetical protein